ncbi:hypothetical protein K435DRAFT_834054 [Dendrothele bispora CBS 962.96]|uniref:Uncharacterized protein n=1 Tax=Dendrothele bispora (strain CBS 962.96) TaxID=1314807 RepID=A0A4S8MUK6_DENBC|nr:hypothetical protein K435DRAFT_834054 [Dendrothele bispora CBS 962.96]
MPPTKPYRTNNPSSQLRASSRSSSATKLGPNLQFTQKEPPHATKKNTQVQRVQQRINASTARVSSKDNIAPQQHHRQSSTNANAKLTKQNQGKAKPGFTIAAEDEDEDDDDDDEWTSESGAATPNNHSSNDTSEDEGPSETVLAALAPRSVTPPASSTPLQRPLARVNTARPADYQAPTSTATANSAASVNKSTNGITTTDAQPPSPSSLSSVVPASASSTKPRKSRPPSMHSIQSQSHHHSNSHSNHAHPPPLRPHPLIRGHSFGPTPLLAPLTTTATTTPSIPPAQFSSSPPIHNTHHPHAAHGSSNSGPTTNGRYASIAASPTTTISVSPPSPQPPRSANPASGVNTSSSGRAAPHRRTSVSSTRSVATLPALSTTANTTTSGSNRDITGGGGGGGWSRTLGLKDRDVYYPGGGGGGGAGGSRRNRTLSTLSSSSSSAAISSLVHAFPSTKDFGHGSGFGFGSRPSSPPGGGAGAGGGGIGAGGAPAAEMVCYFPPGYSSAYASASASPYATHGASKLGLPNGTGEETPIAVHPLLPPPYLSSHLSVLANRTPIRESYDRVMRAKMGR